MPLKYQAPPPLLTVTPSASVTPLLKFSVPPLVLRLVLLLEPSVIDSSVPPAFCKTVPSLLTSVPFLIVPEKALSPPVPKRPAEPMSSVLPPRSSVPLTMLTVVPVARL